MLRATGRLFRFISSTLAFHFFSCHGFIALDFHCWRITYPTAHVFLTLMAINLLYAWSMRISIHSATSQRLQNTYQGRGCATQYGRGWLRSRSCHKVSQVNFPNLSSGFLCFMSSQKWHTAVFVQASVLLIFKQGCLENKQKVEHLNCYRYLRIQSLRQ